MIAAELIRLVKNDAQAATNLNLSPPDIQPGTIKLAHVTVRFGKAFPCPACGCVLSLPQQIANG